VPHRRLADKIAQGKEKCSHAHKEEGRLAPVGCYQLPHHDLLPLSSLRKNVSATILTVQARGSGSSARESADRYSWAFPGRGSDRADEP
jgi:hypothetical protein